jgi:putative tricarboxylic transport membrane protein
MMIAVGFTFIIALSGERVLKGWLMAAFGMLLSLVGVDSQAGIPRYTFGELHFWDGISIVALVVGLFGGAELLQLMLSKSSVARVTAVEDPRRGALRGMRDTIRHWRVVAQSSAIGIGIGMIPGLGGAVSQFIAYGAARQTSKAPEEFGRGSVEGVVAAGANNNAKDGGSLIPTVAFGIPGSLSTAILLGAFIITGLTPGREMLDERLDVTFSMVWTVVLANSIAVAVSFLFLRKLVRLTSIKGAWLVPFLFILVITGSYAESSNYLDIVVMLCAAAFGVIAIRWNWPRIPFLLGLVLGGLAERYFFLSKELYGWSWLGRPAVVVMATLIVLVLFRTFVTKGIKARRVRGMGRESLDSKR